ncbi:hypothetical protein KY330_04540, partial [Candidatus Woesearchaeota archaeon]|nr:hypothetical protein [Candidatus Woesearchaeota archaeon]
VEPELKLFHNFDFMWMASKKGYDIVRKFVNKSRKQFYNQILKWVDEESWEWYNKKVECCFRRLMRERKKELLI